MHKPGVNNPFINQRSSNFEALRKQFGGDTTTTVTPSTPPKVTPKKLTVTPTTHSEVLPKVEQAKTQLDKTTDSRPVQNLSSGGTQLKSSPQFLQHVRPEITPLSDKSTGPKLETTPLTVEPKTPSKVEVSPSKKELPEGRVVKFSENDFLYGPDTGIQKPRTLLRKFIQSKSEQGGQKVWGKHVDDTLKIDSLTSGMGPTPPAPTKHQLGGKSLGTNPNGTPNTNGALPKNWDTNVGVSSRYAVRETDKSEFVQWISEHPRFSPEQSPSHTDWNQRFKRTSKAGLQFALKEKGYNVHFVLPKGTDFDQIAREGGSHPRHGSAKYEAFYQDGKGGETGPIEEKRITHAELRWLFRHKDDPSVKGNVQFWEYDPKQGTDGFTPVDAPWVRDPAPWVDYAKGRALKSSRNGDTSIEPKKPITQAPSTSFVVGTDGQFTKVD